MLERTKKVACFYAPTVLTGELLKLLLFFLTSACWYFSYMTMNYSKCHKNSTDVTCTDTKQ